MTDGGNIIEVKDLTFRRGRRKIFNRISMVIPRGKIIAVMGPSGTGKTTLLKLIGGQLAPEHGHILFNGKNVHEQSRHDLFELRKSMGMLFQSGALFTNLSVYDNVAFPLREHTNLSEALIRTLVLMKLQTVGLRNARFFMPNELSGGMARRVAFARAIALDPEVIMYDEPLTGLDPISMAMLLRLMKKINETLGLTSIIVSHDVKEVAGIADYIYVLSEGKVIGEGDGQTMLKSNNPEVKQFMHGLPDGPVPFHYPGCEYLRDLMGDEI